MSRHKPAVGRYEVIDGRSVAWCAHCNRNVVRRPMVRHTGPGNVYSKNSGTTAHGDLTREVKE